MENYEWAPVARYYDPVLVGSIDATDTEPHDHGIIRALCSTYKPNKGVEGDPNCTLFVGRLNHATEEDTVKNLFSKFGQIKHCRLVRDFITGFSRGYGFVEFIDRSDAKYAISKLNHAVVDDKTIIVMFECERVLPGWIPRRLGGGFGGKKESGQLRFGGIERPFRKPIIIPSKISSENIKETDKMLNVMQYTTGQKKLHPGGSLSKAEGKKEKQLEDRPDERRTPSHPSRERHSNDKNSYSPRRSYHHRSTTRYELKHSQRNLGRRRDESRHRRSRSRDRSSHRCYDYSEKNRASFVDKQKPSSNENFEVKVNDEFHKRTYKRFHADNEHKQTIAMHCTLPKKYVRSQLSLSPE